MTDGRQTRPPRGALIVIAIGLLATVAAAVLSTDEPIGAATLEWIEEAPMAKSKPAAIPGGGQMQLSDAEMRSTEPNISDFTLFRVSALLRIDAGSAIGHGRLSCAVHVPPPTLVAQTYKTRAVYPRSSEELFEQDTPETSLVRFSSHSTELASVDVSDVFGKRYTTDKGIVVEWAPYRAGQQVWKLGLPSGRPKEDLTLPFVSIWRTTAKPAARMSCTVENASGSATVRTAGSLPG